MIIYTSGTTGAPKGALEAHRLIIGNISGFVHSHDFYPQKGDMFWSPADWAWAGGLFDALLPAWYFGMPILGYRGRFDAGKAYYLLEKYGIRNAFLFPTALKLMMKAVPEPRRKYELNMRSIMSAGESVGVTLIDWARGELGVIINEMFGQTEINYVVGNCNTAWPVKPGAVGRPYPGHRVAVIDDQGKELPPGELGEIAVHRKDDPVFFLEYWKNPEATRDKFIGDWGCTGDQGKTDADGYSLVPGALRRCHQERGLPHRAGRDRELPGEAPRGDERGGDRQARRDARRDRQGVYRPAAGRDAVGGPGRRNPDARARPPRAVRVSARDRVHRRAADDHHRQGPAQGTAQARRSEAA